MKQFLSALLLVCSLSSFAQQNPTDVDKSPMDVSYCPANYPIQKMNGKVKDQPIARVLYSRPQKAGREIFGNLVSYNQVWRLGANEATEIEFFKNVKIGGKSISKGRYTMYAICSPNTWTIIFNSEKDVWGLSYNQKKDVARVDAAVENMSQVVESFTMFFNTISSNSSSLNIWWDNVRVSVPISY